jgi:hypothetical protein
MAEHKRKTKEERYGYAAYSYWGVSLMYWGPMLPYKDSVKHTNLYLRVGNSHFDYNLFRAEVKRLLNTTDFVLLNRWRAMSSEYKSFIQFHEREPAQTDPVSANASSEVGTENREPRA